jgi:membrane protease YdiL (CAAX protease family)
MSRMDESGAAHEAHGLVIETPLAGEQMPATRGADVWLASHGTYSGIVLDVFLVIVIQFVLGIALILVGGIVAQATGHSFASGVSWLGTSPTALPLAILLSDAGVVLLLWYRLRDTGAGLALLGLSRHELGRGARGAASLGIAAGIVTVVISTLLGRLLEQLGLDQSGQYNELIAPLEKAPVWAVALTVLLGTFLAPVVEEAFFRGYVFRALRAARPAVWAYVISAAAFGAVHLLPAQFPVFFVSGLILAAVYDRSQNMLANISAHVTNNAVAFVLSLLPLWSHH